MRQAWLFVVASCVVGLGSVGCTERKKSSAAIDPKRVAAIVLDKAPAPKHALDVQFGDRIRLLGYDIASPAVSEGKAFEIVWYWHVLKPLDEGFKVFTHLADIKESRINLDAKRDFREAYPEGGWKKGDYLRDVQKVTLPKDWDSKQAIFYLGFWKDSTRLPITKGPHDDENRARALVLSVIDDKPPPELPRLIARRITGKITLDGKLDEADWRATERSSQFVQTMTGGPGKLAASVRVLYDAQRIVLGYEVDDDYLKSTFTQHDDHLWEQDTIEVMLDPDGDAKNYFEVQVAPTGKVFDTRYDSRRQPRPFGDMAWSSKAQPKVLLRGTLNDEQADEGYTVEVALPYAAFAAGPTPTTAPSAGATWRMAFFVMDARDEGQRAVGWSPPLVGDFHTLDRFGRVVFPEGAAGAATEASEPGAKTRQAPAAH